MKKLIFIFSIFSLCFLSSFTKKKIDTKFKHITNYGSCTVPYNLNAVKNGTQVTLSWSGDPVACSYAGYYNCSSCSMYGGPAVVNFGGATYTWPISFTVASSAYSIHFSVTAHCTDGSYSYSSPYFGYF
ncbi:MAG: hypothetical protein KGM16_16285 [Bacteroidota bacterium]|nr:hypothetical protein [Bacteroidota bacterium]